ncbi:MAG: universal stress protein [Ilumatobacter sp.]
MERRLIVPVDGSDRSWVAVDTAIELARRTEATVHVVEVVFAPRDRSSALQRLERGIEARTPTDIEIQLDVVTSGDFAARSILELVADRPGSVIVMASHGRGRAAAIVGSTTEDVLRGTTGPIVVVGPQVTTADFTGPVVVAVDGSAESETALPVAAAWARELAASTWVVNATDPSDQPPPDSGVIDSAYAAGLARDLSLVSDHPVEFDVLHATDAATAVPEFAEQLGASLMVASSHGRTGLARLTMGSVVSGFVRRATCPVLVVRIRDADETKRSGDATTWAP